MEKEASARQPVSDEKALTDKNFIPWEWIEEGLKRRGVKDPEAVSKVKDLWFSEYMEPHPKYQALDFFKAYRVRQQFTREGLLWTPSQQHIPEPPLYANPIEIASFALYGGVAGFGRALVSRQVSRDVATKGFSALAAREAAQAGKTPMGKLILKEAGKQSAVAGSGVAGLGGAMELGGDVGAAAGRALSNDATVEQWGRWIGEGLAGGAVAVSPVGLYALFGKDFNFRSTRSVNDWVRRTGGWNRKIKLQFAELNKLLDAPTETPRPPGYRGPKGFKPPPEWGPTLDELLKKYGSMDGIFRKAGGAAKAAKKWPSVKEWMIQQRRKRYGDASDFEARAARDAQRQKEEAANRAYWENLKKSNQDAWERARSGAKARQESGESTPGDASLLPSIVKRPQTPDPYGFVMGRPSPVPKALPGLRALPGGGVVRTPQEQEPPPPIADAIPRETERLRKMGKAPYLYEWIIARGGVNPRDLTMKGEIKDLITGEARTYTKGGKRKLTRKVNPKFLNKNAPGFDIITQEAIDHGWLPKNSTEDDLLQLLERDINARHNKQPRVRRLKEVEEEAFRDEYWDDEFAKYMEDQYGQGWKDDPQFKDDYGPAKETAKREAIKEVAREQKATKEEVDDLFDFFTRKAMPERPVDLEARREIKDADWLAQEINYGEGQPIYRQGREEGKWWSYSETYARSFGKRGKPVQTATLPPNAKIIDETVLRKAMTNEELKAKPEEKGFDMALKRLGLDGVERYEETMEQGPFWSVYLRDPKILTRPKPGGGKPKPGQFEEAGEPYYFGQRRGRPYDPRQVTIFDAIKDDKKREKAFEGVRSVRGKLRSESGVSTVYQRIAKTFKARNDFDFRGHRVSRADDLAAIGQVYRDPRFETIRMFYMRGDRIVAHEGLTARLPSVAPLFKTKRFVPNEDIPNVDIHKHLYRMKHRMNRLGADGYYFMHNHPSGLVEPSQPDINGTFFYMQRIPGFKGHLIINHKFYALIKPHAQGELSGTMRPVPNVDPFSRDPLLEAMLTDPMLDETGARPKLRGPDDIAQIAQSIAHKKDYVTAVYLNAQLQVQAVQELPVGMVRQTKQAMGYMKNRMRDFGAPFVALYADLDDPKSVMPSIEQMTREKFLLDAVYKIQGSLATPRGGTTTFSSMGRKFFPTFSVRETGPEEEKLKLKPTEATPYEKAAELERRGEVIRPARGQRKKAVMPDSKIAPPTGGPQQGLFPQPGETKNLFDPEVRQGTKETDVDFLGLQGIYNATSKLWGELKDILTETQPETGHHIRASTRPVVDNIKMVFKRFYGLSPETERMFTRIEEGQQLLQQDALKLIFDRAFKGVNKAESEAIFFHLERPDKYPIPRRLQRHAQFAREMLDAFIANLEARGMAGRWPDSAIKRVYDEIDVLTNKMWSHPHGSKMRQRMKDRILDLERFADELRNYNYVPRIFIPSIAKKLRTVILGKKVLGPEKINPRLKRFLGREITSMEEWVEAASRMGEPITDIRVALADYAQYTTQKMIVHDAIERMKKDPNIILHNTDNPPSDWRTIAHPSLANYKVHPIMANAMKEFTRDYDSPNILVRAYDKVNRVSKSLVFYNPMIMTINDMSQLYLGGGMFSREMAKTMGHMAQSFAMRIAGKSFGDIQKMDLDSGWHDVFAETDLYKEAARAGMFRGPTLTGINFTELAKLWAELSEKQQAEWLQNLQMVLGKQIDLKTFINPINVLKVFYNTSQHLTWYMDRVWRMTMLRTLMRKGMALETAVNRANRIMVDYHYLPDRTRINLNRIFLTPTYRIGALRLLGNMLLRPLEKTPLPFKGISREALPYEARNLERAAIMEGAAGAGGAGGGGGGRIFGMGAAWEAGRGGGKVPHMRLNARILARWTLAKALIWVIAPLLGWRWLEAYRLMRIKENEEGQEVEEVLTLPGPMFEPERWIGRTLGNQLWLNLARVPYLAMSLIQNRDWKGDRIIQYGAPDAEIAENIAFHIFKTFLAPVEMLDRLTDDEIEGINKALGIMAVSKYARENPNLWQYYRMFRAAMEYREYVTNTKHPPTPEQIQAATEKYQRKVDEILKKAGKKREALKYPMGTHPFWRGFYPEERPQQ